ncbi:DNA-binding helix-turn-helix protein [Enterococcus faecalis 13-SD-W-01]|nr:DNA-binding helix-turn-helix protein [Enterococcus faecalis 13-SD-W-01]
MEMNETIKILREMENISQAEVAEGIMSRSSYSKFEQGERSISVDEYTKIMHKLRAHATDLNDIDNLENAELSLIRHKHYLALKKMLPQKDLEELYQLVQKRKKESPQLYRAYLYTRLRFHKVSDKIPAITTQEVDDLFRELTQFNYWTNYYIKLIMDFTTIFSPKQLIYFLERLETYKVEWVSPVDCEYMHVLPGALSNIADSLIDHAVLDQEDINTSLFPYVLRACNKLEKILMLRPSFEYSLLLKLHLTRLEYFSASTPEAKEAALNKVQAYLQEVEFIENMKSYRNEKIETAASIVKYSLTNILETGRPGAESKVYTV